MIDKDMRKSGFTLVETVLSAVVMGIALIALGLSFYTSFVFIDESRQISQATLEAAEEIENIRNMSFDNILSLGPSYTFIASGLPGSTGAAAIDNIYGSNDIRRVSAAVAWTTRYGKAMSRSLVTLVARNGIDRK